MARGALRTRLRSALTEAAQGHSRVTLPGGRVTSDGRSMPFIIDVKPLSSDGEKLLLICFVDAPASSQPAPRAASSRDASRIAELERELEAARAELEEGARSLEASGEEQRAINEESLSVNEEYQSTNEEQGDAGVRPGRSHLKRCWRICGQRTLPIGISATTGLEDGRREPGIGREQVRCHCPGHPASRRDRNGVPDEQTMGHTRNRSLTTMRSYVRRAKLSQASPARKLRF